MNITSFFKFIEPIQDQLSGFYSTATLIITLVAILWFLNFIFSLIFRIYSLGKSLGGVYRNYIHKYIRIILFSFINLFQNKKLI